MEKKPRLRAPNFTSGDHLLLCEIVDKYKHVIENKKTDGANLIQKQKAWLEVEQQFNSTTSGCSRTLDSLQQNYKNLKKKAKKIFSDAKMDIPVDRETLVQNLVEYGTSASGWKKVASNTGATEIMCKSLFKTIKKEADVEEKKKKRDIMRTGGGPPPENDNNDPVLQKIQMLVGPAIDGMYTIYDGDSGIMASQNSQPIESTNFDTGCSMVSQNAEEPTETVHKEKDAGLQDETHHEQFFFNDRANLKKKPHHLLTRKRKLEEQLPLKQTVSEKFKTLASEKMELVAMQKELLKMQLEEEREKNIHNKLLRDMEIEELKKKYDHYEIIRKIELERLNLQTG